MTGLVGRYGADVDKARGEVETWLAFWLVLETPLNTSSICFDKFRGPRNFRGDIQAGQAEAER